MDNKIKIASNDKNLRLCVIENTIFIEELASRVLGTTLNIDWEKSKSFGHASGSLSFHQKLQLIQDIKGIDKEDIKKVVCISNIRNKFAHVSSVDSFSSFFSHSSIGKEVQAAFLKWYFDDLLITDIPPSKLEFAYRVCFYGLVDQVINILLKISDDHIAKMGIEAGKRESTEMFLHILIEKLKEQDRHDTLQEAIEELTQSQR